MISLLIGRRVIFYLVGSGLYLGHCVFSDHAAPLLPAFLALKQSPEGSFLTPIAMAFMVVVVQFAAQSQILLAILLVG